MGPLPSPTWASKLASERWLGLAVWALVASACRGEYTQPPTACDDYCLAVQRADCSEDYPADCVRDCAKSPARDPCAAEQRRLNDCYAATDASEFQCVNERSQPGPVCLPERRALSECLAPTSGPCFDECLRQADECGATLTDCEARCQRPTVGCELASHDYNACLLQLPTECRPWLEPDTRKFEDIPCGPEALAAWFCGQ